MKQWTLIMPNKEGGIALVTCIIITTLCLCGTVVASAAAQKVDKSIPKQRRTLALAEDEVKRLLLLMDTDKSGKISKKEFMAFMESEFNRLDTDKSGELDVKELANSQVRPSRPQAAGK